LGSVDEIQKQSFDCALCKDASRYEITIEMIANPVKEIVDECRTDLFILIEIKNLVI
jgi:hypothetical protein